MCCPDIVENIADLKNCSLHKGIDNSWHCTCKPGCRRKCSRWCINGTLQTTRCTPKSCRNVHGCPGVLRFGKPFAGGMVLSQEVWFFLLTVVALIHKPAYFLCYPRLAWETEGGRRRSEVLYYTLMPEKWLIDVVASDFFRNFRGNRISSFCQMLTTIPNFFSVYTLALLQFYGEIWWAFVVGYSVTAAGFFIFLYHTWGTCKHFLIEILCCMYLMTDKFPWEWKYTQRRPWTEVAKIPSMAQEDLQEPSGTESTERYSGSGTKW